MEMKPEDVRIDTFRSGSASGWIAKPETGVRILHIPTGIEVTESEDRSIHKNKAIALEKLTALVEQADPVPPKVSELDEVKAKLALALEALELAETIMDICGGDAYERECAEPIRDQYQQVMDKLNPPPPPQEYVPPYQVKSTPKQEKIVCPICQKKVGGPDGLAAHNAAKHGNSGLYISSMQLMIKEATQVKGKK